MSIGTKNEKSYIKITDRPDGFAITALKRHATELEPLFGQYGIACRRETGPESDTLVFDGGADRGRIEEILTGYEGAKGS
jgi:hypothetical protein